MCKDRNYVLILLHLFFIVFSYCLYIHILNSNNKYKKHLSDNNSKILSDCIENNNVHSFVSVLLFIYSFVSLSTCVVVRDSVEDLSNHIKNSYKNYKSNSSKPNNQQPQQPQQPPQQPPLQPQLLPQSRKNQQKNGIIDRSTVNYN
jgi:hypothetical protein